MSINKLQQCIRKMLINRHSLITVTSCILLFLCGQLSAFAQDKAASNTSDNASIELKRSIKQDPTLPPSVIVAQLSQELAIKPEYELTAIFTRDAQQYAVINGDIVKKGDAVSDMQVIDITADQLVMRNPNSNEAATVVDLVGAISIKKQVTK